MHIRNDVNFIAVILISIVTLFSSPVGASLSTLSGFKIEKWVDNSIIGEGSGLAVDVTGNYGYKTYMVDSSSGVIYRIDGKNNITPFAQMPGGADYEMAFDVAGDFGGMMYVIAQNDVSSNIYSITPAGDVSLFYRGSSWITSGIEFGSGGAFGTSMYVIHRGDDTILRIDPNGDATELGSEIDAADRNDDLVLSEGGPFGEFIYTTRVTGTDMVQRTSPNGVTTDWALVSGGKSIAMGQGIFGEYLYLGGPQSLPGYDGAVLMRYDASGNMEVFVQGLPQTNDNPVRGLAITDHEFWLYNTNDGVYRITQTYLQPPVPEMGTNVLVIIGIGILLMRTFAGRSKKPRTS